MTKRILDLVVMALAAVPALAFCLVILLMVKSTSHGPVLYWSRRIGAGGREFWMPKFRTMRPGAPEVPTHLLVSPYNWITPVGLFLRKTSLDELPQLVSVLRGDMSIVGPRPALHDEADLLAARRGRGIDVLVPGITGWAQVNGRDNLGDAQKVEYDHEYLRRRSLSFDLRIIVLTIVTVLSLRGVAH